MNMLKNCNIKTATDKKMDQKEEISTAGLLNQRVCFTSDNHNHPSIIRQYHFEHLNNIIEIERFIGTKDRGWSQALHL